MKKMRHCKTCENCTKDLLSAYLKGIDYNRCVIDGHYIEEPFWEKCDKYVKSKYKKDHGSSFMYQIVKLVKDIGNDTKRKNRKIKRHTTHRFFL